MTRLQRIFPWFVLIVLALWVLSHAMPPRYKGSYDWKAFEKLPVSGEGRVKPLDTVARNSLMVLSGRQTIRVDGELQPPVRWWADVVCKPDQARDYPIFRIDHPDVLALLGLKVEDGGRNRLSFNQIMAHRDVIAKQAQQASEVKSKDRNPFQRHVLELWSHINLYLQLEHFDTPYVIPPLEAGEEWQQLFAAFEKFQQTGQVHPGARAFGAMLTAYREGKGPEFNGEVQRYTQLLEEKKPRVLHKAGFEVFFNHLSPFYHASAIYVIVFLLGSVGLWLRSGQRAAGWVTSLAQAAAWTLLLAFVLHTFGLGSRIYLQGRPPVTNLYSSAVFIGWGCVLLALVLLRFWKHQFAPVLPIAAAAVGFVTLIIAHHLGDSGDTMEMMQAVLDSNFWLATHVVTITIGYSTTFLAGALAIAFILLGVFTRVLAAADLRKSLVQMIYAAICFSLFFSFVGTVLGGIWADQSWGRFWGWDPKENGAVLIVLIHAIILHARWGGLIRDRGIAVLAVFGNIVTSWSWFGTNMLGIGLHSYGFMDSAMFWLIVFVLSQLAIMAIGLWPLEGWRSLRAEKATASIMPVSAPAASA